MNSEEELRKALEWYADPMNYEGHAMGYEWGNSVEMDKGARARRALGIAETPVVKSQGTLMNKYHLWGADIESDIVLDLNDPNIKRRLIELKVMIDRTNGITTKFVVANGKVRAYPDPSTIRFYKDFFIKRGEQIPTYYQDDLYSKSYDPQPIYSGIK